MKKVLLRISDYIRRTDLMLILMCLCASAISVLVLASILANDGLAELTSMKPRVVIMQIAAAGIGLVSLLILSRIDYHALAKMWKVHLPLCVAFVLLTFTRLGMRVGEADDAAWINLFDGFMSLQPTEILKISFILSFSYHLSRVGSDINRLKNVLALGMHAGALVLLVHFQGDDGTALIFAVMFVAMVFVAGLGWRYIVLGATALAVSAPVIWLKVMVPDQRERILALYRRDEQSLGKLYQQTRGLAAIGSGQVVGTGLFTGDYNYVPSMRNDFIFSLIGNAMGFVGCMIVVLLLAGICIRIVWASHIAADDLGRYICVGVFSMIASQSVINIGMNLMLLPVVGVTLPLFSAGGTSVVGIYLGMGIVLSVYMHSRRSLFLDK